MLNPVPARDEVLNRPAYSTDPDYMGWLQVRVVDSQCPDLDASSLSVSVEGLDLQSSSIFHHAGPIVAWNSVFDIDVTDSSRSLCLVLTRHPGVFPPSAAFVSTPPGDIVARVHVPLINLVQRVCGSATLPLFPTAALPTIPPPARLPLARASWLLSSLRTLFRCRSRTALPGDNPLSTADDPFAVPMLLPAPYAASTASSGTPLAPPFLSALSSPAPASVPAPASTSTFSAGAVPAPLTSAPGASFRRAPAPRDRSSSVSVSVAAGSPGLGPATAVGLPGSPESLTRRSLALSKNSRGSFALSTLRDASTSRTESTWPGHGASPATRPARRTLALEGVADAGADSDPESGAARREDAGAGGDSDELETGEMGVGAAGEDTQGDLAAAAGTEEGAAEMGEGARRRRRGALRAGQSRSHSQSDSLSQSHSQSHSRSQSGADGLAQLLPAGPLSLHSHSHDPAASAGDLVPSLGDLRGDVQLPLATPLTSPAPSPVPAASSPESTPSPANANGAAVATTPLSAPAFLDESPPSGASEEWLPVPDAFHVRIEWIFCSDRKRLLLERAFSVLDADGKGFLDEADVEVWLLAYDIAPPVRDIWPRLHATPKARTVSFAEFLAFYHAEPLAEVLELLRLLDVLFPVFASEAPADAEALDSPAAATTATEDRDDRLEALPLASPSGSAGLRGPSPSPSSPSPSPSSSSSPTHAHAHAHSPAHASGSPDPSESRSAPASAHSSSSPSAHSLPPTPAPHTPTHSTIASRRHSSLSGRGSARSSGRESSRSSDRLSAATLFAPDRLSAGTSIGRFSMGGLSGSRLSGSRLSMGRASLNSPLRISASTRISAQSRASIVSRADALTPLPAGAASASSGSTGSSTVSVSSASTSVSTLGGLLFFGADSPRLTIRQALPQRGAGAGAGGPAHPGGPSAGGGSGPNSPRRVPLPASPHHSQTQSAAGFAPSPARSLPRNLSFDASTPAVTPDLAVRHSSFPPPDQVQFLAPPGGGPGPSLPDPLASPLSGGRPDSDGSEQGTSPRRGRDTGTAFGLVVLPGLARSRSEGEPRHFESDTDPDASLSASTSAALASATSASSASAAASATALSGSSDSSPFDQTTGSPYALGDRPHPVRPTSASHSTTRGLVVAAAAAGPAGPDQSSQVLPLSHPRSRPTSALPPARPEAASAAHADMLPSTGARVMDRAADPSAVAVPEPSLTHIPTIPVFSATTAGFPPRATPSKAGVGVPPRMPTQKLTPAPPLAPRPVSLASPAPVPIPFPVAPSVPVPTSTPPPAPPPSPPLPAVAAPAASPGAPSVAPARVLHSPISLTPARPILYPAGPSVATIVSPSSSSSSSSSSSTSVAAAARPVPVPVLAPRPSSAAMPTTAVPSRTASPPIHASARPMPPPAPSLDPSSLLLSSPSTARVVSPALGSPLPAHTHFLASSVRTPGPSGGAVGNASATPAVGGSARGSAWGVAGPERDWLSSSPGSNPTTRPLPGSGASPVTSFAADLAPAPLSPPASASPASPSRAAPADLTSEELPHAGSSSSSSSSGGQSKAGISSPPGSARSPPVSARSTAWGNTPQRGAAGAAASPSKRR